MRALGVWLFVGASVLSLSTFGSAAEPPTGIIAVDLGDRLLVSDLDGTKRRVLVRTRRTATRHGPVWSPDGSRIAFARGGALYVATLREGRLARLANLPPSITSIRWAPDGTRIAFGWATRRSCAQPGASEVGLFVVNVGGSNLREIVDVEKTRVPPSVARFFDVQEWSPNGKRVLYVDDRYERGECRAGFGEGRFLRHVAIAGGRSTLLARGSSQARWSPDGSLVALDVASGCALSVVRPDGRATRLLLGDNGGQACFDDGWIDWSPSGEELYVARWDSVVAVRVSNRGRRMLLGDLGLCSDPDFTCTNSILALSRDGERLLIEAEGRLDPILVLVATGGTSRQRLPHPGPVAFDVFVN